MSSVTVPVNVTPSAAASPGDCVKLIAGFSKSSTGPPGIVVALFGESVGPFALIDNASAVYFVTALFEYHSKLPVTSEATLKP